MGAGLLMLIIGVNAVGLAGLWLTLWRKKVRKPEISAETEALIARAIRARDPMCGKEVPPLTMTPAEMRAEAERRSREGS